MGSLKKYDAVVAGYTCIDLLPGFKKNSLQTDIGSIFKPGKLVEIESLNYVLGGVVPNTGLAMKKFGRNVFLNGLIGDDFIGKMALEYLGKYKVSEGIETTKDAGTAFSIVLAPPGVDRIFLESPGCSHIFNLNHINFNAVEQSRLFHFGYPPLLQQFYVNEGEELARLFSRVQKMGVATSLDFSLPDPESESGKVRWRELMKKVLPFVDVFVPSLEEALYIMMPEKYTELSGNNSNIIEKAPLSLIRELGRKIIDSGVKILLIKAGDRGIYLITDSISELNKHTDLNLEEKQWNDMECWCNAYKADTTKVVSASGAGDTAVAAFLSAILDGEEAVKSVKFAAMAGRNNLYCQNIYSDLSDWDTMTKEMDMENNEIVYFQ